MSSRSRSPRRSKSPRRNTKGCFECGRDGHIARYCPNKKDDRRRDDRGGRGDDRGGRGYDRDSRGGGSRTFSKDCYNCNRPGHFAKDCPEPPKRRDNDRYQRNDRYERRRSRSRTSRSRSRSRSGDRRRYNRDDRSSRFGGGQQKYDPNRPKFTGCFNCQKDGHYAKDCPDPPKPREERIPPRKIVCYGCNKEGHIEKDCPKGRRGRSRSKGRRSASSSKSSSYSRSKSDSQKKKSKKRDTSSESVKKDKKKKRKYSSSNNSSKSKSSK